MEFQIRTKTMAIILSMCFGLVLMLIACTGPEPVKEIPTFNLISSKSTVSSAEAVTLTATGDVTRVEFFRGGTKIGEDSSSPFTMVVPLAKTDNGKIAFTAIGFDATGTKKSSEIQTVKVAIFDWPKVISTPKDDFATGIATDKDGNVFVTGYTDGVLEGQTSAGGFDAFLVKFDSNGRKIWTKQFGTVKNESTGNVVVDGNGNVYVTGISQITAYGEADEICDGFVVKFDSNGGEFWKKQFGVKYDSSVGCPTPRIALSKSSDVFLLATTGVNRQVSSEMTTGLIARIDSDGKYLWSNQFFLAGLYVLQKLALDRSDNIFAIGKFGPIMSVLKFDFSGKKLFFRDFSMSSDAIYSNFNLYYDKFHPTDILVDKDSNVYIVYLVTGNFRNPPDQGFIIKVNLDGNVVWSNTFMVSRFVAPGGMKMSNDGYIYLSGRTTGRFDNEKYLDDDDPAILRGPPAVNNCYPCPSNKNTFNEAKFVAKFDLNGQISQVTRFSPKDYSGFIPSDLALDLNNNTYVLGSDVHVVSEQPYVSQWDVVIDSITAGGAQR
jgi:Beta-propeller repeat